MRKTKQCPVCGKTSRLYKFDFKTGKTNASTGREIIVTGVMEYRCSSKACRNSWLPWNQEKKILTAVKGA